ncbi:PREDICTED: nicastrin isoform X2 [Nicotiana attenuata]|uniref:nicastrin isoform X2 n=1 Tax=Nicotiana attenuata TaxID=49451 RepID=UPI0009058130|nr:PREDICTED: nicastrin isoform X2 [Nicotiana attenuata]
MDDTKLLVFLLCFIAQFCLSISASDQVNSFQSVPDLEKSMYMAIDGYPCVRLLNLSGEIGCSNPGRANIVAPVARFKTANKLAEPSALMVSIEQFEELFGRLSNDAEFSRHVVGVLVESGSQLQNGLKGFSPDKKFPQAEFAPYQSGHFEWNPIGSGLMWKAYNFPVFLLSNSSTSALQEIALRNEKRKKSYTVDVADFNLVMQTTKSGTRDSESCLREQTCLPLGGYSVWSALPPMAISSSEKAKPVILVVASMDAASFFRDKSIGADSPISGLISLLAVVDALSRVDGLKDLDKQLVFAVFTGEAWGYLGSRRFLLELDQHSDAVSGLDLALIETVLEIGSVGKGFARDDKTFFAHSTSETATNGTLSAIQDAVGSLKTQSTKISRASKSNPGLPPSSLMSFLKKNPKTSGVVLEDFDTAFTNKFYHSHLDDLLNINSSAIVAAASVVARSLYILASDKKEIKTSALNTININASLVEELLGCLLSCEPGLSCELVNRYIAPSTSCPSHYVGVVLGEPSSQPYPGNVGDVPRFVWNFLADKTAIPSKNLSSTCPKGCSGNGEMCVKAETDGKGVCVISTTRYIPAYSTRLKYESDTWEVLPHNSSDIMGEADPVWTESNWETIKLRVYTVQDTRFDTWILLLGIAVTVLSYIITVMAKAFITKALKRD